MIMYTRRRKNMFNWMKKSKNNKFDKLIEEKQNKINFLDDIISKKQSAINELSQSITITEGIIMMEDLGLEYAPESLDSNELNKQLISIQNKIALLLRNNLATERFHNYTVNKSSSKGESLQKTYSDSLLYGFNAYYSKKEKSITSKNFNKTIELLTNKFNRLNKKGSIISVKITDEYFSSICELLKIKLSIKIANLEEKERIKEEKHKLKEQEKLLAEAEKEKQELQKQRRMYEQSLLKALTEEERQNFENQLKQIDKREADIDYRINNQRAGYLYIAKTKGMPDLVKIGVTRRLNPLVRISELSSASVPYPFKCYGLVFSDDVFSLEKEIHDYFDDKRYGLNKHKEFFKITPQEAIDVLQNKFKCQVHFTFENNEEEI